MIRVGNFLRVAWTPFLSSLLRKDVFIYSCWSWCQSHTGFWQPVQFKSFSTIFVKLDVTNPVNQLINQKLIVFAICINQAMSSFLSLRYNYFASSFQYFISLAVCSWKFSTKSFSGWFFLILKNIFVFIVEQKLSQHYVNYTSINF